jgi:hypothetical protein
MKAEIILEFIKKQGFSIFLLCAAIWWFNKQYDRQQLQIDGLNNYIKIEFKNTLEKNTEALNRFTIKNDIK